MTWNKSKLVIPILVFATSGLLLFIRLFGIRVATVRPDRIGHLAGEVDLYIRKVKLGLSPKHLLIITGLSCNKELIKILRRHACILSSEPLYRLLSLTSRFTWQSSILHPLKMTTREYDVFERCTSVVSLTPEEVDRGYREIKKKFGIERDDWWVCFHSRDGHYLNSVSNADFSYHRFRDFDINDMLEAMEMVASKGGYAIRFGSSPEKILATANSKIIDYSFRGRTDFLDIFLCSEARFFIGSTSGPFHLPKLFDTPYAICNLIGYGHLTPSPKTLFITKKIVGPTGQTLSFADCSNLGMFDEIKSRLFYHQNMYEKNELSIVNNSDEEIKKLTEDMFDLVEGKDVITKIANVQRIFKDKYFCYSPDRHSAGNIAPSFIKLNPQLFK